MRNVLSIFFLGLLLTACGGAQQTIYGMEETTQLVIRSESLVGKTVSVGNQFSLVVAKENLTPFKMGILGSKEA